MRQDRRKWITNARRAGAALAFLALAAQPAAACRIQPGNPLDSARYHLEMRILATHDLPSSGQSRNCRLTVEVLRVMRAPPGFSPGRREVFLACNIRGQWSTTCGSYGLVPVDELTVGRRFTAGLNDMGGGRLGIIGPTFRGL